MPFGRWSRLLGPVRLAGLSAAPLLVLAGCVSPPGPAPPPPTPAVRPIAHTTPVSHASPSSPAEVPFAGAPELTEDAVVAAVLTRNPTVAQMTAAWRAAAARYPQVTSLDDPRI